ncbi:MAG: D-alanyl-D-alanine carboxypeptidase/D-alanyl-D-alanine-endopeptidase [Ferruginibacter sp.]
MKFLVSMMIIILPFVSRAQNITQNLSTAIDKLQADEQFKHAIISMYVVESRTGKLIYEKNAQIGMAPASCQKVITSTSAFELLGKNYTYKTLIGYDNIIANGKLKGNLFFTGRGDPTLGSWRWSETKPGNILQKIAASLNKKEIKNIDGSIYIDDGYFSYQPIPDGWIWQDIGNYYGAGAWALNWHENQYDLNLKSTNDIGAATEIISTEPVDLKNNITNLVVSAKKGSGDNVYIYSAPYYDNIFATGTIPAGENGFTVSGSIPNPPLEFAKTVAAFLKNKQVSFDDKLITYSGTLKSHTPVMKATKILDSIVSPPLDSINYWFLKKSINLYGEALVKTIAYEKAGFGSTDSGVAIIKDFWSKRGIEKSALKIIDGSGLSPANRVTTNALVTVMQFARQQNWFSSFYFALPEMNDIKMKDGYINGVRAYTGYVKSKVGIEYTFSFIVNNFDGSPGSVREKMWKVLDLLK